MAASVAARKSSSSTSARSTRSSSRAACARRTCTARSIPYDVGDEFVRDVRAEGHHPLGQPRAASRRRRHATRAGGGVRRWACRCSASATACRRWRSSSAAAVEPGKVREFGYAEVRARGHSRAACATSQDRSNARRPRPARRVDEPRRQGHRDAARLQADRLVATRARSPAWPTRRGGFYARAVPSRGHAHAAGQGAPRALRPRDLRLSAATGTCPTTSPRRSRAIRAQVGRDEVHPGTFRRRRLRRWRRR